MHDERSTAKVYDLSRVSYLYNSGQFIFLGCMISFLMGLVGLRKYRLDFTPIDASGRLLATACLRWLGTTGGPKYLQLLQFDGPGVQGVRTGINTHSILICSIERNRES